ncbi:MAG: hypothetical protein Rubg2KO_31580 [Rubricoccaceae bacterium]
MIRQLDMPLYARGLCLLVLFASPLATAQTAPPVIVDVSAIGQSYTTDDGTITQVTVPLRASFQIARNVSMNVRTAFATASGDGLEPLSGLTDTQVGTRFSGTVGKGIVDVSLSASLPTGQTALSLDQLATASTLSLDDYAFATPSFGRGAVLAPGISVALPVSQTAAVGMGAVYSISSEYTLVQSDEAAYMPGNELLLTAGLDATLGRIGLVTVEGSYVQYGDDSYREATYSPGGALGGTVRLALGTGPIRTRLLASARRVTDGTLSVPSTRFQATIPYTRPTQNTLALGVDVVQPGFDVGLTGGFRTYASEAEPQSDTAPVAALANEQVLLDIGIAPSFRLSSTARLRGAVTYTRAVGEEAEDAPFSGMRASAGLRIGL